MKTAGRLVMVWGGIMLSCYVLLEWFFFHYVSRVMPLATVVVGDLKPWVLMQTSKQSVSPENYMWVHKRFKSRPNGEPKNALYKNMK